MVGCDRNFLHKISLYDA